MDNLDRGNISILFSQAHSEQLTITEDETSGSQFSSLHQLLVDLGYIVSSTAELLMPHQLADVQILVVGAPRSDQDDLNSGELTSAEIEAISQFVTGGGGLLLISDSTTMLNPPPGLNRLAAIAGLQFQEYLNYPPTFLQIFQPHYVTANVSQIQVGKIASLTLNNGAYPVAFTQATKQPIIACANVERGRVVTMGDDGLFTDDLLAAEDNKTFVANTFRWLAGQNVIDLEEIIIPKTVKWGQTATVELKLRNSDAQVRPQIECVLESDEDALISEPTHKSRSIPPGRTTRMQWTVRPQTLGNQKLRLNVHIEGQATLFFDQLPELCCLAPGYLTLEIRDKAGEPKTTFQTGEYFIVEGAFHWAADSEPLPYKLQLNFNEGLVERSYEPGNGIARWHLQAVASGTHNLMLNLIETDQSLPALVTVSSSISDQLAELQAAYVYPLDSEIAERLKQMDKSLSDVKIKNQSFNILPPEKFIEAVYRDETMLWLRGVLAAARREQWYNFDLLNIVLTYISPAYLPDLGSFIPYDPSLTTHLAQLHPAQRRHLEANLLCSKESEAIQIKQNIAAYLLHEKYGHGFFYTKTRLGQQLTHLLRHGLLNEPGERYAKLIRDSALIVSEGFATWLELTFLAKLDPEVRQAVHLRHILLIQEASGLYERERESEFFRAFPPRFDSRYREGFEYLDFISRTFNIYCAVRAFLIATDIKFGITEDTQGRLQFELEGSEIERRLLDPDKSEGRSHSRLREIAGLLYEHREEAKKLVRKQHCPDDCREHGCPLETFVMEKLQGRI